jgi:competence protein ComEC
MNRARIQAVLIVIGLALVMCARVISYETNWNSQTLLALVHSSNSEKGKKVVVVGKIVADPDARDTTLHANIEVETIDGVPIQGTLIAFFPPDEKLTYGQHVVAKGTLRLPDAFLTETGVFDYPHYLQAHGIAAMMTSAQLATSTKAAPSLFGILFSIKHTFDASLEKLFVPPHGALMEGILLGEQRGIPADVQRAFIVSSLVHIVVLSGGVLTLVADALMRTLSFLPLRFRYPLGALLIVLFVLMVGASSTAVRAGAIALIGLLARFNNRTMLALRTLFLVAFVMILWNPAIALWDTSFILSVLASLGLITLSPAIEKMLWFVPQKFELRGIAAATVSVEIFIVPALLHYTGTLSFFALPANILALPVLPWAMLAGFVAGALNLIPGVLGLVLAFAPAFVAQLLLRWIVFVAETIAHLPYAAATVVGFPLWAMLLCYVPIILVASWTVFRTAPQRATSSSS